MLILALVLFLQQHSYTPAEIDDGRRIYQSSCGTCHGALGDAIPGIDLGRGIVRRGSSDEELTSTIRAGVAGTNMPPFNFSDAQATAIIAYLRNMTIPPTDRNAAILDSLPPGDITRGKAILEGKGQCLTCHWVNGAGSLSGPDLSAISAPRGGRTPAELHRSLVEPNAEVRPENRTVRVVPQRGDPVTGKLLNQDTHSVQLLHSSRGLTSIAKSDLREVSLIPSPMPSFKERLAPQELSDVLAYLISLKGQAN
jgi:putative heme-binding domain-containing protein